MSNTVADATKALDIIREAAGSGYIPYFVNPNMLLGLGHLRCMSDTRLENPTPADIETFHDIQDALSDSVQEYYCVVNEGRSAFDDRPYVMLELYSCQALSRLHEQPLMPLPALEDTSHEAVSSYLETLQVEASRKRQHTAHQQPMQEFKVHWLIGLLCGYPLAAVAAMPPFWEYGYEGEAFEQRVLEADIEHAWEYFQTSAGMCVYDFPWFLAEHSEITQHQRFWSGYFREFYNSDWHQQAEEDEDVQATLASAKEYTNERMD